MASVPRVPLERADDLVERIMALKADADGRGFGTLAYFLDMALHEASALASRLAEGKPNRGPWRPIGETE